MALPTVRVDSRDLDSSSQIVYATKCSLGLGVTLFVFGILFFILGIAEVAIPPFPTARYGFIAVPLNVLAGVFGILASRSIKYPFIQCVVVLGSLNAVLNGLLLIAQIARIIVVIIAIPLAEGEGPDYYYYFHHDYNEDGSIAEYDEDPTMVPIIRSTDQMDFMATGLIFGVEILLMLAAFVVGIIESACACRTTCGGVKTLPKVMIQQPDGSLAEATVKYEADQ